MNRPLLRAGLLPVSSFFRAFGRVRPLLRSASLVLAVACGGNLSAQQSNLSCSLTTVPFVNGVTPSFTVTQSSTNSGTSTWLNQARTVDADTTNFATGTIGQTGSLTLRVSDLSNTYASGDFAGFTLASSLISPSALGSLTVRTYLTGVQQEATTGSNLIAASAGVIGAYQVGFYTNKPFNAIELVITNAQGAGSYFIYHAILRGTGSCTSPALVCNTTASPGFPAYAVVLNSARTGVTGLSAGALANTAAAVDNDPATYVTLTTTTAVQGIAFISVRDATTTYVSGTTAGFDVENATLLNPAQLGNVTVNTYRDGVLKQSRSGSGLVLGASVSGTAGRQRVGFVADSTFNEVQIVITQPATVSLGTTRIYAAGLRRLCALTSLPTNGRTPLTESNSAATVAVANTGIKGPACAGCSITGLGNMLDADPATAATIVLTANALDTAQVAILDPATDYPAGTMAGFDVANAALQNASILSNVFLEFYRDGVLKQTKSGSSLLVYPSGTSASRMILAYRADSTFDQVKMSLAQATGVNFGTTSVYGMAVAPQSATLPLHVLSFRGTTNACHASLDWETGGGDNTRAFDVEASADGRGFDRIAQVAASAAISRYAWGGEQAAPATYYRLRATDASGAVAYSNTVLLQTRCAEGTAVAAQPNPARGVVTLTGLSEGAVIEMYSMLGAPVLRTTAAAATQTLGLQDLPAGQYQLRIRAVTGAVTFIRLAVHP